MGKALLFLAAGLAAGFALSAWLTPGAPRGTPQELAAGEQLGQRVAALERTLERESRQREALAAEVAQLRGLVRTAGAPARATQPADGGRAARSDDKESSDPSTPRNAAAGLFRGRFPNEQVERDRLIAAGFSTERAAYIERRASELRMQALEAQYEARRSGRPIDARTLPSTEQSLRDELGDVDYERYLTALGRPTNVGVGTVLASSPAEQAGLEPGDEITSYAGQRVFNIGDLNRLTYQGQPGETVPVDIVRNGEPLEIYVPRGPIGITASRFGPGVLRRPRATAPANPGP